MIEICTNNIYNGNLNEKNKNKISRSEYWKLFTDDLKKYCDIKITIKERQDSLDKVQKEVTSLNKQKQDVSNYLQIAISFINSIISKISYYKGFMDHHKDINDKINLSSRSLNPFIIIIYNIGKDKDNNDNESKQDKISCIIKWVPKNFQIMNVIHKIYR